LKGGINTYGYVGANPTMYVDPDGLEYGAAYGVVTRADGWRPPGPAGSVRSDVKAYLCNLIEQCKGNVKCIFNRANADRKRNRPESWNNSTYREAENWAYTAGWNGWQNTGAAIGFWQLHKHLPGMKTTPPSMDAWLAGLEGRNHFGDSPADLAKWCDPCGK
jgi:uncharacterized protein RhaS with RHS repeats